MRELFRYRDLIRALVARDLKVRYRRSTIGFMWTMLHPFMTMLVLMIVFSQLFRFDIENYSVYALMGILFWNFVSQSITASMNSLRGNAVLLTKLPVPKAVFPLATVLSGTVNLVLALVPLGILVLVTGHPIYPAAAFLPVAIVIAAVFALGIGLLISPMAAYFSDVIELVSILLTLLLYLTPIFYPISIVPEDYRWIVENNPVGWILEIFRQPVYRGVLPDPLSLAIGIGIALGTLAVGIVVFRLATNRVAFYL